MAVLLSKSVISDQQSAISNQQSVISNQSRIGSYLARRGLTKIARSIVFCLLFKCTSMSSKPTGLIVRRRLNEARFRNNTALVKISPSCKPGIHLRCSLPTSVASRSRRACTSSAFKFQNSSNLLASAICSWPRAAQWTTQTMVHRKRATIETFEFLIFDYEIARAMRNAAPAAALPMSAVCKALRNGFMPVKRPLIKPKTNKAANVMPIEK
jgi:hypothetical protein